MGDSDELFARIIAGLEIPSVSGCNGESKLYIIAVINKDY